MIRSPIVDANSPCKALSALMVVQIDRATGLRSKVCFGHIPYPELGHICFHFFRVHKPPLLQFRKYAIWLPPRPWTLPRPPNLASGLYSPRTYQCHFFFYPPFNSKFPRKRHRFRLLDLLSQGKLGSFSPSPIISPFTITPTSIYADSLSISGDESTLTAPTTIHISTTKRRLAARE